MARGIRFIKKLFQRDIHMWKGVTQQLRSRLPLLQVGDRVVVVYLHFGTVMIHHLAAGSAPRVFLLITSTCEAGVGAGAWVGMSSGRGWGRRRGPKRERGRGRGWGQGRQHPEDHFYKLLIWRSPSEHLRAR